MCNFNYNHIKQWKINSKFKGAYVLETDYSQNTKKRLKNITNS